LQFHTGFVFDITGDGARIEVRSMLDESLLCMQSGDCAAQWSLTQFIDGAMRHRIGASAYGAKSSRSAEPVKRRG